MSAMDINTELELRLQSRFDQGDTWSYIKTKGGGTQNAENNYKTIFKTIITDMGSEKIIEAGSQQKNDMTVVWPGTTITYELKKTDAEGCFKCNDSTPDDGVVYVFFSTKLKKVKVCPDIKKILETGITLKKQKDLSLISEFEKKRDEIINYVKEKTAIKNNTRDEKEKSRLNCELRDDRKKRDELIKYVRDLNKPGEELNFCNKTHVEKIRTLLDEIEQNPTSSSLITLGHTVIEFISQYVNSRIVSLCDFAKIFKKTYDYTNCQFRPRPNFDINFKTVFNN